MSPRPLIQRAQSADDRDWIDKAFIWGLFGFLMVRIWAPVVLVIIVILVALLGRSPDAPPPDDSSSFAAAAAGP